jgi:hypothetical protein
MPRKKQEVEEEDDLELSDEDYISELESENERLRGAVAALGAVVADELAGDEDDTDDAVENGLFSDALAYGSRRLDERKARKLEEKAAKMRMRAQLARKKAER